MGFLFIASIFIILPWSQCCYTFIQFLYLSIKKKIRDSKTLVWTAKFTLVHGKKKQKTSASKQRITEQHWRISPRTEECLLHVYLGWGMVFVKTVYPTTGKNRVYKCKSREFLQENDSSAERKAWRLTLGLSGCGHIWISMTQVCQQVLKIAREKLDAIRWINIEYRVKMQ